MAWSAIAVTCKTKAYADAVKTELKLRQQRGCLPKDIVLLCVEDPQEGLGSGGATLNALLVIAEHLSARSNLTAVSSDILDTARILIIHLGRYYSHDPCGRAFVPLPIAHEEHEMDDVVTNFDALYCTVTNQLSVNSPPGLWVCSSDMILSLAQETVVDWGQNDMTSGVCCISVPATPEYAKNHGVYKIDDKGLVSDIIYKGTESGIRSCMITSSGDGAHSDMVSLVSGIVFFSRGVTEKLLSLHTCAPLDACTYMGIDSGVEPIQISLYFDVLLCMAYGVSRSDFVCGKRSSSFGHSSVKHDRNMELVRATLWERLRGVKIKAVVLCSGKHRYLEMTETPLQYSKLLGSKDLVQMPVYKFTQRSHSFVEPSCTVDENCIVINSLLHGNVTVGEGSALLHCHLKGDIIIGKNCVIIGLDEQSTGIVSCIPDNSFVMGTNINIPGLGKKKIFSCLWDCDKFSISDDIGKILDESEQGSQKCGISRNDLLRLVIEEATPLPPSYLNVMPGGQDASRLEAHTYFTAKLFPVLHTLEMVDAKDSLVLLKTSLTASEFTKWKASWKFSIYDLLERTDHEAEFAYRKNLSVRVVCQKIKENLLSNEARDLSSLFTVGVLTNKHNMLFSSLDEAALLCVSRKMTHLCARVFSCIAEVLALMAGKEGGLRSGPAANKEWQKALLLLERGDFEEGIKSLVEIRKDWLGDPDKLKRAARHYERAEHIFIRHACTTVSQFISTVPGNIVSDNTWLICECPARIDLSGGWSDTPPICYENGGTVVNVALMIENKRPVGARVRLIEEPIIVMKMLGDDELPTVKVTCETTDSFRDYCQPQAAGALLKACFVLCEIVSLDSDISLQEQLMKRYGKGLEIQTWSKLPRGSGLGTSSILAGAVITALLRAVGRIADTNSVIHAVLMLEQMLTTGGGWQDQVGGMVGGIKVCSSKAMLPLKVETEPIVVSDNFLSQLQERMKLIYTGKTRLARNLLQDVLRNWYAKKPEIINNCKNLVSNAHRCKHAFQKEDLKMVGECVDEYWKQKKVMAPGCEPASCTEIMKILRPHVHGQTLAGAGGGGFMCIILKEARSKEFVGDLLKNIKGAEDLAVYDVKVDKTGAQVYQRLIE